MGLWGQQEWKGEEWVCRAQRGPLSKPTLAKPVDFLPTELLCEQESMPSCRACKNTDSCKCAVLMPRGGFWMQFLQRWVGQSKHEGFFTRALGVGVHLTVAG